MNLCGTPGEICFTPGPRLSGAFAKLMYIVNDWLLDLLIFEVPNWVSIRESMFFASAGLLRSFCGILLPVLSFVLLLSFTIVWNAWRRGRWADAMDVGVHGLTCRSLAWYSGCECVGMGVDVLNAIRRCQDIPSLQNPFQEGCRIWKQRSFIQWRVSALRRQKSDDLFYQFIMAWRDLVPERTLFGSFVSLQIVVFDRIPLETTFFVCRVCNSTEVFHFLQ